MPVLAAAKQGGRFIDGENKDSYSSMLISRLEAARNEKSGTLDRRQSNSLIDIKEQA